MALSGARPLLLHGPCAPEAQVSATGEDPMRARDVVALCNTSSQSLDTGWFSKV